MTRLYVGVSSREEIAISVYLGCRFRKPAMSAGAERWVVHGGQPRQRERWNGDPDPAIGKPELCRQIGSDRKALHTPRVERSPR